MNDHLDPERLAAWLGGELPAAERAALLDHLETGCTRCEALLDDDVLARLLAAEEAGPVAAPPMRIVPPIRSAPPTRRWLGWVGLAAAVALAAVFVPQRDRLTEKGESTPSIRLEVAVASPGSPPRAERTLADGESVPRGTMIVFQLDADTPAARYLTLIDGAGRAHPILPPEGHAATVDPAGSRPVTWEGDWLAFVLDDVPGPVTLVATATAGPVSDPVHAADAGHHRLTLRIEP